MTLQPKPTDTELASRVRTLEEQIGKLLTSPGPPVLLPWFALVDKTSPFGYVSVGGETAVYSTILQNVPHNAVKVSSFVAVDVGTTADIWLARATGFGESDKLTVVGDGNVYAVTWAWIPEWESYIGDYESSQLKIMGERTAGLGAYAIHEPWGVCAPATEIDATTSGLGVLTPP